jgi:CheY-like chemotaxis protein
MEAKTTVLLAEDEESVRKLVRTLLEGLGYRVLAAEDGFRALDLVGDHPGAIDLLITDMKMPGMSGRELADRLCSLKPGLKVLYISGYTEDDVGGLRGCGGQEVHFLAKPFTGSALRKKIHLVLASSR